MSSQPMKREENQACVSLTPKRDKWRRIKGDIKTKIYLFLHGVFWRILFSLGLGWKFHQFRCRHGLSWRNGRCSYCGFTKDEKETLKMTGRWPAYKNN